ncbi:hypothetical protein KC727_01955 [Candidatus Kaiserbacteria bacterium]|nr:hypothetical protein [Candidatus Kaiserbacteria bacterium]
MSESSGFFDLGVCVKIHTHNENTGSVWNIDPIIGKFVPVQQGDVRVGDHMWVWLDFADRKTEVHGYVKVEVTKVVSRDYVQSEDAPPAHSVDIHYHSPTLCDSDCLGVGCRQTLLAIPANEAALYALAQNEAGIMHPSPPRSIPKE